MSYMWYNEMVSDDIEKRKVHPNSLANLQVGGKNHEPVKNLARKIRGYDDDDEERVPIFQMLFDIVHDASEATKDRIHAAEVLLNRGWGRAIETIVFEELNPATAELRSYSLADLRLIQANALAIEGTWRDVSEPEASTGGTPETGGVVE